MMMPIRWASFMVFTVVRLLNISNGLRPVRFSSRIFTSAAASSSSAQIQWREIEL